jgi:hypothetical protein
MDKPRSLAAQKRKDNEYQKALRDLKSIGRTEMKIQSAASKREQKLQEIAIKAAEKRESAAARALLRRLESHSK